MGPVHRLTVRVRYTESDPMGRLHHSAFPVYFELGRTELMRDRGLAYASMEAAGRFIAIARIECRFLAAARYDDLLVVETSVREVRGARVVFANRVLRAGPDGETPVAEGTVTGALVDAAGRPRRFSPEETALLTGGPAGHYNPPAAGTP
jgi:acyl-CoA thioester hydrolase